MTLFILISHHPNDVSFHPTLVLSGVYTRQQVSVKEADRMVKKNEADCADVYQVPDLSLNKCFVDNKFLESCDLIFTTDPERMKKVRESKQRADAKTETP